MNTNTDELRIEGLTNADILELETKTKVTRLTHQTTGTPGAHHDMSAVPIVISAAAPLLTLLGCMIVQNRWNRRNKIKIVRISKDDTTIIELDERESTSQAPKADLIQAVANALKIDPAKIVEALAGK